MTEFSVNTHRFDPYKNFKFRVKWKNKYVPGIFRVSGLNRSTAVVEHRDGGDPNVIQKSPGTTTYSPLTLERARTHDTAFEDWADKVLKLGASLGKRDRAEKLSARHRDRDFQRGRTAGVRLERLSLLATTLRRLRRPRRQLRHHPDRAPDPRPRRL